MGGEEKLQTEAVHAIGHGHYQWHLGKLIFMKQHVSVEKTLGIVDLRPENVVEPVGSDQELAQLSVRLVELEASYEKAKRRIERLLGERNQLSALLDKRDEQIQHLYQELGTRRFTVTEERKPKNSTSPWRDLLTALTTSFRMPKSRRFSKKSVNEPKEEAKASMSNGFKRPPLFANYKKTAPQAVLAVLLYGLDKSEIVNLLPVIERDCRATDMMPLLLTDNDAFELLREHNIIFEYLPPAEDRMRFDDKLSWNLYIQRRLAIVRKKWQPSRVIALGGVAADTLRLWQQSPFEEFPLPTASNL